LGCVFHLLQIGQNNPWKTGVWAWAFGLLALAAALGAIAHGFQMSPAANLRFWQPLNLALGLVVALFVVGVVYDLWGLAAAQTVLPVMVAVGVAFFGVMFVFPGIFLIFILYEAAMVRTLLDPKLPDFALKSEFFATQGVKLSLKKLELT
jgi:hypothetical protein